MSSGRTATYDLHHPVGTDALDVHGDMQEIADSVEAAISEVYSALATLTLSSGTGTVVGPGSSTDNAIPRFNTTSGVLIQNSGVTIDGSNNVDIPGTLYMTNITPTTIKAMKASRWGYSSSYRALILGDTATSPNNVTVSIGYDPSGNTNGSFTGNGSELLIRNAMKIKMPNAADNGWLTPLQFDSSGNTTLSGDLTTSSGSLDVGGSANDIASNSSTLRAVELGGTRVKRNQTSNGYSLFEVENGAGTTWLEVYADGETSLAGTTTTVGIKREYVEKTSADDPYAIQTTDHIINCTSGTFTVTLPAAGDTGREYVVKNSGSGTITVDADGSETIDGETSVDLNQYDGVRVIDTGTNWSVM